MALPGVVVSMSRLTTILILLFLPASIWGETIFQDDFESDPSDWTCSDGQLSKWSATYMGCGTTSGFGPEWKMGPGHNSNNAVYAWKKTGVPATYRSESQRWLTGSDVKTEVYHRWYMKVPSDFDKECYNGFKFWRYMGRENGYPSPPEIYLNAYGTTFKTADLAVLLRGTEWLSLTPISDFNDGDWHCHEIRIKFNSFGESDGIIEYWLDGSKKASFTGKSMGSISDMAVHRIGVGIGNTTEETEYPMTEWTAIAFDDIIVSTEYIGPLNSSASTPTHTININCNIQ